MADNFHGCLAFVLKAEGGWSDDADDHGGCTMRGITLAAYRDWKHNPYLTCNELRNISILDVTAFYHDEYWVPMHCQDLPAGVDLMVLDCGVNTGVSRSAKILQKQVNVIDDGVIGPVTITNILRIDPVTLINSLAMAQRDFYFNLAQFPIFGKGWINRLNARHSAALLMTKIA